MYQKLLVIFMKITEVKILEELKEIRRNGKKAQERIRRDTAKKPDAELYRHMKPNLRNI